MDFHRNGLCKHENDKLEEKGKKERFFLVQKSVSARLNDDVFVAERPDVEGSFNTEADHLPTHLIVMVNGITGSARNWRYAAKKFLKAYPNDIIVHCSETNPSTLTFDGVDVMGKRLADEVISVVGRHENLKKISFVGHSFGGLVARYAAAFLYRPGCIKESGNEKCDCGSGGSYRSLEEEEPKGKIVGLEPVNFITLATPHVGSKGHKQVPLLCGFHYVEKVAFRASWILGRTGKHLFLTDGENGKPPLLLQMSKDCDDLKYISCLESFKRRVAYANTRYDHLVAWSSASLRPHYVHPKSQNFLKNGKYPHIFNEETSENVNHEEVAPLEAKIGRSRTVEMQEAMVRGLTRLPWERVDVDFSGSIRRYLAHGSIQVKNYCINSDGADVIQHMIDGFYM